MGNRLLSEKEGSLETACRRGEHKGKSTLIPRPAYVGPTVDKSLFPQYYLMCTSLTAKLWGR